MLQSKYVPSPDEHTHRESQNPWPESKANNSHWVGGKEMYWHAAGF